MSLLLSLCCFPFLHPSLGVSAPTSRILNVMRAVESHGHSQIIPKPHGPNSFLITPTIMFAAEHLGHCQKPLIIGTRSLDLLNPYLPLLMFHHYRQQWVRLPR
jgi:hypothetical protein